jgi:N-acyl-D-aspartate/D-glutamate deacylase
LVREGYTADLVAFDPETVGTTEARRTWDLPAGADRLVVDSLGIEHVWVGGVATRTAGVDVKGATPGRLLRR